MLLTSIHLLTFTSFALASPLKFRRQDAVTITSTVTVPASSATTTSSTTSSTTSIVPLIPTALPAPGSDPSTNPPLLPCKEVCRNNSHETAKNPSANSQSHHIQNIAYDACIAGCTIVDGQPQANAPPLVVVPPGEETSSTSRVARATEDTPAAPTCEEYCRSNVSIAPWLVKAYKTKPRNRALITNRVQNIAYDACISYCQIVDGQPQLNAPPLIVTPPTTEGKTSPSTPAASPAATLDQLLHACQASCVPGSSNFGNCRETCETLKGFAEKGIAGSSSEGK
ncbi:MAG: hypothetical protein LQ348_006396 [Seirophora lacunosa]|nr:MAG: hypothetical protein LQ348_006396 [Seirophora lacunosa]